MAGFKTNIITSSSSTGGRTLLEEATSFYFNSDGNDTTGDGTEARPWATFQGAIDNVALLYDCGGNAVTFNPEAETYAITSSINLKPLLACQSAVIAGVEGTVLDVSSCSSLFAITNSQTSTAWTINAFSQTYTGDTSSVRGVSSTQGANTTVGSIKTKPCQSGRVLSASKFGSLKLSTSVKIDEGTATSTSLLESVDHGYMDVQSATIDFQSATLNFNNAFIFYCLRGGSMYAPNLVCSNFANVSNIKKYSVSYGGAFLRESSVTYPTQAAAGVTAGVYDIQS